MSQHWGPLVSRQQVGIEHVITHESNTVRNVRSRILQRTNFAAFNFDGQVWWAGFQSGSHRGRLSGSNIFIHATLYSSHGRYFSNPRNVHLEASSVTHSPGQTPSSHVRADIHVPARPAQVPNAPTTPTFSQIGQTTVRAHTNTPANNGAAILEWNFHWMHRATGTTWGGEAWAHHNANNMLLGTNGSGGNGGGNFRPLVRNRRYICRVRCRNSVGWGPWSGTSAVTTAPGVPNQGWQPVIDQETPTGFRMTWGTPSNNGSPLNGRHIQVATNAAFSPLATQNETDWNTEQIVTGRTPNTRYWTRVRVRNAVGWGPWSLATQVVTPTAEPAAPTNVTVTGVQSDRATISWNAALSHGHAVTAHQVELAGGTVRTVTLGNVLSHTALTLPPNAAHQVRVRAENSLGWGAWSDWVNFSTPSRTPDAPGNLRITDTQTEAATIAWNAPFNGGVPITGYRVEWSLNGFVNTESLETTGTTATLAPLVPGTAYSVRVRAINSVGNGPWASMPLTTLPGVYVRAEGQWRPALAHVRVAGVWRRARVWKRANGAWHL